MARAGKSIAKLDEQFPAVEISAGEPKTAPAFECNRLAHNTRVISQAFVVVLAGMR
jgi:hypothetical protein